MNVNKKDDDLKIWNNGQKYRMRRRELNKRDSSEDGKIGVICWYNVIL